jgi:hypothetical protein
MEQSTLRSLIQIQHGDAADNIDIGVGKEFYFQVGCAKKLCKASYQCGRAYYVRFSVESWMEVEQQQ